MRKRRIKTFLSKDRKSLHLVLGIVIVSIFTLSIAYAVLSTTLNITGSSEIVASNWDINLDNIKVKSGSIEANTPEISGTSSLSFEVNLTTPGDFYEFTVDIVNDGSIDAMIDSVVKIPELTEAQAKYIKYEITYENGDSINEKQTLKKETTTPIKVRVEYRNDLSASDLPRTTTELSLGLTLIYVQSDGSGSEIPNNGAKLVKVVSGDGSQVGDEVCIKNECFYVLSSTESTVTMLAKYNLYVGATYDDVAGSWTTYGEEATGMQDSTMVGFVSGQILCHGAIAFSNESQHGSNYTSYSGSIVEERVNNYKTSIEKLGIDIESARLITKEELNNSNTFECLETKYCSDKYPWIYSTSYWTSVSKGSANVGVINTSGYFGYASNTNNKSFGVRPVIIISKDLI